MKKYLIVLLCCLCSLVSKASDSARRIFFIQFNGGFSYGLSRGSNFINNGYAGIGEGYCLGYRMGFCIKKTWYVTAAYDFSHNNPGISDIVRAIHHHLQASEYTVNILHPAFFNSFTLGIRHSYQLKKHSLDAGLAIGLSIDQLPAADVYAYNAKGDAFFISSMDWDMYQASPVLSVSAGYVLLHGRRSDLSIRANYFLCPYIERFQKTFYGSGLQHFSYYYWMKSPQETITEPLGYKEARNFVNQFMTASLVLEINWGRKK